MEKQSAAQTSITISAPRLQANTSRDLSALLDATKAGFTLMTTTVEHADEDEKDLLAGAIAQALQPLIDKVRAATEVGALRSFVA